MYPHTLRGSPPLCRLPFIHQATHSTHFLHGARCRRSRDGALDPVPPATNRCGGGCRRFHCTGLVRPRASGSGDISPWRRPHSVLRSASTVADDLKLEELWQHASASAVAGSQTVQESAQLLQLVTDFQTHGHTMAKLDPLGLDVPDDLDLSLYRFTDADLDRKFLLGFSTTPGFLSDDDVPVVTLREILRKLRHAYCGAVGYEYMHVPDRATCEWLRDRIETTGTGNGNNPNEKNRRLVTLESLVRATLFENFLATRLPGSKRYGIDGGEALIPGVEALLDRAAELGVEGVVMGTSHRGRLNLMANVLGRPVSQIISELTVGPRPAQGDTAGPIFTGTGELYLQQGVSCDRPARGSNSNVHVSLVAHPCHLEAVDPVVMGKTRAKQFYSGDVGGAKTMSVLVHGDGAFTGQGVVYETLNLSALKNYTTGGTVHLVLNNRVAATTDPSAGTGRSSRYCTDVARALGAPVFHVNADDVEAVVRVCRLAAEWRQAFRSDVVVDLVCYRRFGHNEVDDPTLTLPKMYKVIKNHPSSLNLYEQKLLRTGEVSNEDLRTIHDKVNMFLNEEFAKSKDFVLNKRDWLSASWTGFKPPEQISRVFDTGVKQDKLKFVGRAITKLPVNFKPHKAVQKLYEQRVRMIETGEGIDWAFAEALAFATLLEEGNHVRLSGQDVERGNFNQRHAILHDQETGSRYCPFDQVVMNQNEGLFTVSNSLLSEYAVLGFEMGYSMENPNSLVLWEAQFGDFANCAQVIFDQFLSCAEARWLRQTGLVVLLPHGYDGQGPDHSGAHLERFLQMCNDNPFIIPEMEPTLNRQIQECNWQVVNVTTPANYFHVLRRQIHREFRKPLIVMAPKNLLWHKDCKSNIVEFEGHQGFDNHGTRFKRLIEDPNNHRSTEESVKRLILCSGKVYYELDDERKNSGRTDVAICRVEQLCPFPYDLVQRELKRYPNAEIVWCQEEPMNMGAYSYVSPRLHTATRALGRGSFEDIKYVGRAPSASAATGFPSVHAQEQSQLLKKALEPEPIKSW
ncbi:unnamed protein product [Urochloa decumbens]|uniref:Transketolase-like pyrimidine-binding domain-containing protein n=1 Tax=Urochloa decumbens TaxID=240449 RepID=A0ABC9AFH4_9POAL